MLDQELKKIVKLTTRNQRNWDVSVPFPRPHTEKIVDFVVIHPSKESWNDNEYAINYLDLLVVTDDSIKRAIYDLNLVDFESLIIFKYFFFKMIC